MTKPNTLDEQISEIVEGVWASGVYDQADGEQECITYINPIDTEEAKQQLKALFTEHSKERETELLDALYWMYVQYCNGKNGHMFMSAGETASELLEDAGYIVVDSIGEVIKDNGDSFERSTQLKRNKGEDNGYTYEQKN